MSIDRLDASTRCAGVAAGDLEAVGRVVSVVSGSPRAAEPARVGEGRVRGGGSSADSFSWGLFGASGNPLSRQLLDGSSRAGPSLDRGFLEQPDGRVLPEHAADRGFPEHNAERGYPGRASHRLSTSASHNTFLATAAHLEALQQRDGCANWSTFSNGHRVIGSSFARARNRAARPSDSHPEASAPAAGGA